MRLRNKFLLGILLAATGCGGGGSTGPGGGAGGDGRTNSDPTWPLVYARLIGNTNDSELYLAMADGRNSKLLVHTTGFDEAPSWSPNGQKIVFEQRETSISDTRTIVVVNADGTGLRQLGPAGADWRSPAWSRDGQRIVFHTQSPNGLATIAADGTDFKQVSGTQGASSVAPSYLVDGRLLFSGPSTTGNTTTYVIDANGGNATKLADDAWAAVPSPNGSLIAFWANAGISVMNPDGSGRRLVVPHFFDGATIRAERIAWSPDGTKLLFTAGRNGGTPASDYDLYLVDAAGGTPVNITNTPGAGEFNPDWRHAN